MKPSIHVNTKQCKKFVVDQVGITLEFLPDDNTVIKVESTDFKVTR